jgi:membrane protease YdiL (CAAX protease family)
LSTHTQKNPEGKRGYFSVTRSLTYSFLIAVPLLALYEVLIIFANSGRMGEIRVSADVWIKRVMANMGGTGLFAIGLAVLLVGVAVFLLERDREIPIRMRYFGWMLLESCVYAGVLGWVVGVTVGTLFNAVPPIPQQIDVVTQLALSLGAGIYEELVFRVVLVGGLFWLLKTIAGDVAAYILSAVIAALIFSAVHYIGSLGDAFTLSSFTFRFLFGLALNALFLLRGFGVAAWTHALYDVSIVFGLWT